MDSAPLKPPQMTGPDIRVPDWKKNNKQTQPTLTGALLSQSYGESSLVTEGELGIKHEVVCRDARKKQISQNTAKDSDHTGKGGSAGGLQCCSQRPGFSFLSIQNQANSRTTCSYPHEKGERDHQTYP